MYIENEKVVLRNMVVSDVDDIIDWNTKTTEWMNWDAPWEHEEEEDFDWDAYRIKKEKEILAHQEGEFAERLEVCINNEEKSHIGLISCYFINEEFRIVDKSDKIAIGMDICDPKHRGNGYGKASYMLYIEYLKTLGYQEIYTQTWSGNISLIKMVEKLGFQECNRYVNLREVNGKQYDGLTFILK